MEVGGGAAELQQAAQALQLPFASIPWCEWLELDCSTCVCIAIWECAAWISLCSSLSTASSCECSDEEPSANAT